MNINCYKHYKRAKIKYNEPLGRNHSIVKEIEPESYCQDPAANLQEIQRTEEHVELYYEYESAKSGLLPLDRSNAPGSSQIYYKKKKEMVEEDID